MRQGTPVVNGSGDGLLANTGSGCDAPKRLAVTLGTSASSRQTLSQAVLDETAGTFCYKADAGTFVLGCASNNGGNVLNWAAAVLGGLDNLPDGNSAIPVFIPYLYAERSPDWNPGRTGSWHDLTFRHGLSHLRQSVIEGVVFNLANYVEILENTSGIHADQIVLSGNGFLNKTAAAVIASLAPSATLFMSDPGLASLRGAAVVALRGLGHDPHVAIEQLVAEAAVIPSSEDENLRSRYRAFKAIRAVG
jgi:gluconokinase